MELENTRSLKVSGLAFVLQFANLFVLFAVTHGKNDVDTLREWQRGIVGFIEVVFVGMVLLALVLALIDDLRYHTFSHLAAVILMSIVLNALLVIMVKVSVVLVIGLLIAGGILIALDMSFGTGPFSLFLVLCYFFGTLTPIILILIAIGAVFGLNMVF